MPFLADLVTMADPTSRHSFLEYLRAHDRLYRFYLREQFHLPRREYDHYCRWVAGRLAACRFGTRVEGLRWLPGPGLFEAELTEVASGRTSRRRARNLVLGVGWAPAVPAALAGALGKDVFHAAEFLDHRERLRQAAAITVVGSGQSGAEVFLELLGEQPGCGYRLDWLTRSAGFFPMEYSRLGLEHFTPDYTRYFHGLPAATRDRLLPTQDLLYKGIDVDTIAAIGDLLYERTVAGADTAGAAAGPRRGPVPRAGRRALAAGRPPVGAGTRLHPRGRLRGPGHRLPSPNRRPAWTGWPTSSTGTRGAATASTWTTGWPPTRGSPAACTCRTASSTPTGSAPPTWAWGRTGPPPSSTPSAGREVYRLPARTAFTDFGVD